MKNEVSVAHLEQPVVNEISVTKARKWSVRILKVILTVGVSLVALYFVALLIWRFSGSNQWEFVHEKNGVKLYTLKSPGSDLIQIRGIVQVRSTLSGIIAWMQDYQACIPLGCLEPKQVERVDDQLQYYSFQFDQDFPFQRREYVIKLQVHQNPHTKEVLMELAAALDKTPPNDCCFRVTQMYNTWRLTPLENGLVQIEHIRNMTEGGFMPEWWLNRVRAGRVEYILSNAQDILSNKKYQDTKFDFIKEK